MDQHILGPNMVTNSPLQSFWPSFGMMHTAAVKMHIAYHAMQESKYMIYENINTNEGNLYATTTVTTLDFLLKSFN